MWFLVIAAVARRESGGGRAGVEVGVGLVALGSAVMGAVIATSTVKWWQLAWLRRSLRSSARARVASLVIDQR